LVFSWPRRWCRGRTDGGEEEAVADLVEVQRVGEEPGTGETWHGWKIRVRDRFSLSVRPVVGKCDGFDR